MLATNGSSNGSSKNIVNSIMFHLSDGGFSLNDLDVLALKGTVNCSGSRTGVTGLNEQQIEKPL